MKVFSFTALLLLQKHLVFPFNIFDSNQYQDHEYGRIVHKDKYQEPEEWEKMAITEDINNYRQEIGDETLAMIQTSTITVNVYFHVMHKADGSGNLSDHDIAQQMDVLNEAFSGISKCQTLACSGSSFEHGDTINTPFHFELAEINRIEDNKGFNLDSSESNGLQKSLRKGSCADMYVFTGKSEYLGAAMYASKCPPFNFDLNNPNDQDSILIDHRTVPGGGHVKYDQGKTLVHEVGHWLGLFHTFEGGCSVDGDSVPDTPPEESPAFGCQVGRKSCSNNEIDSVHNFMSYSDDCCMYHFTPGQTERMILQAGYYRGLMPELNETLSPSSSITPSHSSFNARIKDYEDDNLFPSLFDSAENFFQSVMNRLNF